MVDLPGGELQTRQAEVDEARVRLAKTIDRLTGASGPDSLKQELMDQVHGYKDQLLEQARDYKDQLLEQARDKGRDTVQHWTDELKARVKANPTGAALIGAGVAWRLYKHPPITTLLLGAGAYLLMRSEGAARPSESYQDPYRDRYPGSYVPGGVAGYGYAEGTTDRLSASAADLRYRAQDAGSRARHAAEEAAARAVEFAEEAGSRVSAAADEARTRLTEAAGRASEFASDVMDRTRSELGRRGAAAADFAQHASGEMGRTARSTYDRAGEVVERAQSSPIVLGSLGLVAGAALARAMRATETGDRFFRGTSEVLGRGTDYATSGVGSVARRGADAMTEMAGSTVSAVRGAADAIVSRVGSLGADEEQETPRGPRRARPESAGRDGPGAFERASEMYDTAVEETYEAGRRAAGAGRRAGDELLDLARRYPLVAGTLGLALGAVIGGVLRTSETENRYLGPVSDRIKTRAWELAEEGYEDVVEAAQGLGEDVRDAVEQASAGGSRAASAMADADPGTVIGGRSTATAQTIGPDGKPSGAPRTGL